MRIFRALFILAVFTAGVLSAKAQDVITLKSGEEIKAKVTEISAMEIKYKRFENLDGPTIVIEKAKVFAINYENGTREVFKDDVAPVTEPEATEPTKAQEINPVENYRVKKPQAKPNFGIFVNPNAALTFGPMVGAEFSAGLFDIEVNVFFSQWGLINNYRNNHCEIYWGNVGFGVAPKFYTNRTNGGFYVGCFVEYYSEHSAENNPFMIMDAKRLSFGTNIGYKFVLPFGLYFRTGGYLGADVAFARYYSDNEKTENWGAGWWQLFGFIDIAIGYNFLKVKR